MQAELAACRLHGCATGCVCAQLTARQPNRQHAGLTGIMRA
jgi:hypothetical protein